MIKTKAYSDETWLIPWPEEAGHYWFHGWRFGDDGSEPETYFVRVTSFR